LQKKKSPSNYSIYKTTDDGVTLYLNIGILDNSDLQEKLVEAVGKMLDNEATTDGILTNIP
jgi:hypothetical protein